MERRKNDDELLTAGVNIKLVLEYDGSRYYGFQRQPRQLSIQQALENALSKLFDRTMKIKSASGRTDTGVHALGQVVNFVCPEGKTPGKIQQGLNALLPSDIVVISAEKVAEDFHARFSARSKRYVYRIWNAPFRSPIHGERAWHISIPLHYVRMRKAIKLLIGRHDFRSFAGTDPAKKEKRSTIRSISRFVLKVSGPLVLIEVEADGFLYHMVRNLVGTIVDVGSGKLELSQIPGILKARDRRKAGRTAPAKGLFLAEVTY